MHVTIKTPEEIALMREAGRILGTVHNELKKVVRPGISTMDIDKACEELIRSYGCEPSFKGYEGFPGSACVSVNDEVIHGIPSEYVVLQDGDIVSIDTGVIYKGYQSDAARTWGVGDISEEASLLIKRTEESFFEGMKYAKAGFHLHRMSAAIGDYASKFGYGVVREFTGHGIGTQMHEDPPIPNYRKAFPGIMLKAGMTLAVEPMINLGTRKVCYESEDDDWTIVTQDGSLSAHYENTILITEGEPEILSLVDEK